MTILLVLALIGAAVPGVFMIDISTGFDMLLSSRSQTYQDYTHYQSEFGKESIVVLLKGDVEYILSPENLQVIADLEEMVDTDPRFERIMTPLTFLEPIINAMAPEEGLSVLADRAVVKGILYGSGTSVRPELAGTIPNSGNIIINIVPSGDLTADEEMEAQEDIEQFLADNPIRGTSYLVSSDAEVMQTLSQEIGGSMAVLLGLAIVAMFVILFFLFRVRWRLLSLLMVLLATLWAFGLMGYFSIPLSMATMAVLPIIIGLGIDYSLQFHNRYCEELRNQRSASAAIINSVASISPGLTIAFVATAIGFLTLLLSQVPMVKDFGIVLALGIFLSYFVALFLLNTILTRVHRKTSIKDLKADSKEASHREERLIGAITRRVVRHPIPVLVLALAVFLAGAVLDHRLPVVTDWERLMPQDVTALMELNEIRRVTGHSGELKFMVEGQDILRPEVLQWMNDYAEQEMELHHELQAAVSPSTFITQATGGTIPHDEGEVAGILSTVPAPLREGLVNQQQTIAVLSFPLEHLSLDEVNHLLLAMEKDIDAPDNVRVAATGSFVLGTRTMDVVVSARLPMIVAGVTGVILALLLIYRRVKRIFFAVLPMSLVIGWSSAAMYVFGIPLNPLTAILSAIIIGIGTEFAVLLLERYHEEMTNGRSPRESMMAASSHLGRAIVTSALTTLGGFACLIASDFVMIRDFGIVTVIDVFLCMVSVMIVLPPLVVWFDEWRRRKALPKTTSSPTVEESGAVDQGQAAPATPPGG